MNCQSFENIIDDVAREQLIEAGARAGALRHSEECESCAQKLADERKLTLGLRALAHDMQAVEAPARLETELLAAFSERKLSRRPRSLRWGFLSAAAAVLLLGFGIGIASWNWSGSSQLQVAKSDDAIPAVTEPLGFAPAPAVSPFPTMEGQQARKPVAGRKPTPYVKPRRGREQPAVNAIPAPVVNTEVATDFMPIGYVNSLSLQDGGAVVRVELPRSTIVSMGFAVNMDRYGERVKADVLMGADGLARAIRFVQ